MIRINIICILICYPLISHSQSCCSGGVPINSSIGIASGSKNTFQSILVGDFNHLNKLMRGSQTIKNGSRERQTTSLILLLNYSFSDYFSMDLTIPWASQFRKTIGQNNDVFTERTNGFGDMAVLIKYQFINPSLSQSSFSIGVGLKSPTGKTTQKDSNGITLSLDMQPGSGSYDQLFWSFYSTRPSTNSSLYLSSLFQKTGVYKNYNGRQQYQVGHSFIARIGFNKTFTINTSVLSAYLEAIPRKNWMDKVDFQLIPNTGGHWVFLKPGFLINFSPAFSSNIGIEFPLYSNVTGEQLSSSLRVSFQLIHRLESKSRFD